MANIKDLLSRIENGIISYEEKLAALSQVENTIKEMKQKKQEAIQSNVSVIVDTLKNIQSKVEAQLAEAKAIIPEQGPKGDKGDPGDHGLPGKDGKDGKDGSNGKDGKDGEDGVSVTDARVDFDGSLILVLSTGREINAGEVVGELQDRTAVITQLNALLPDQSGNSGKFLTTDGNTLSWATAGGGGGGSGTVTSVALTVPTGLTVTGSPITAAGTLAVTYTTGYSIPTTANQTNWTTAYGWGNHASAGYAVAANNLSDLTSASTARTNLGLGTMATANTSSYTVTGSDTTYAYRANNLSDLANAATARTNLGLGTAATMTGPSGTIVGTTDTQTLTNKRINPRVVAASATSGSLTPNGDTTDLYNALGLTGAITLNAPSGTPVDGQKLIIRLEDNGTGRGITWTTSSGAFRAVGVTLPTTTVASKVTYIGCVYNSTDIFWDIIAVATQA